MYKVGECVIRMNYVCIHNVRGIYLYRAVVTAMGRQISAFISTFGAFACLFAVGLLSCDLFCRIFLPYVYPRFENQVIIIFLT